MRRSRLGYRGKEPSNARLGETNLRRDIEGLSVCLSVGEVEGV